MGKQELKENIREAIKDSPYRNDIQRVGLFGSYAYGTPDETSDVDLLIEFVPSARIGMFAFSGMHNYFEDRLQKKSTWSHLPPSVGISATRCSDGRNPYTKNDMKEDDALYINHILDAIDQIGVYLKMLIEKRLLVILC